MTAHRPDTATFSRRDTIRTLGIGAAAVVAAPQFVLAQAATTTPEPPSTITDPPRSFAPDAAPNVYFWDPDVVAVDPSFNGLAQPNAPIQRLWTGALWAEGPAWNAVGKFLLWSDVCFGGPKRNVLFMAASQSLYAVHTATQGAGPA